MSNSSNSNLFSFLAGAATGVAVGMYVKSDQGQRDLDRAKKELGKLEKRSQNQLKELNKKFNRLKGEITHTIENVAVAGLEKTEAAASKVQAKAQKKKSQINSNSTETLTA